MDADHREKLTNLNQGRNDAENQQPWRCDECGTPVRPGMNDICKCFPNKSKPAMSKTKLSVMDYEHPEYGFRNLLGDELADDLIEAAGGFDKVGEFMKREIVPLWLKEKEEKKRKEESK